MVIMSYRYADVATLHSTIVQGKGTKPKGRNCIQCVAIVRILVLCPNVLNGENVHVGSSFCRGSSNCQ